MKISRTAFSVNSRRAFLRCSGAAAAILANGVGFANKAHAQTVRQFVMDVQPLPGSKMGYNGKRPGQVISAEPGDRIDVHLINNLPPNPDNDDCPTNHNSPHGANTTNLHTHGLHVSPYRDSTGQYDADNIFLKVTPKGQVNDCVDDSFRDTETAFRFEIPDFHPSGTFWYHAHKHGATASQVIKGLAGPLIIRDRPGTMPAYIEEAPERIFMLLDSGAVLVDLDGGGKTNPTINLKRGSVERWRIINANPAGDNFVRLVLGSEEIEFWQIAFDGLTYDRRVKVDFEDNADPWENHAALAPGNRTDFMVHVPRGAAPQEMKMVAVKASPAVTHSHGVALTAIPVEIKIVIEDDEVQDTWSDDDALPGSGLTPFADVPSLTRKVTFANGGQLVIDDEAYDGIVKNSMKIDTAEEWTVKNEDSRTHPFHIHVNPFFVTHINGIKLPENSPLRRWQDTIALPPTQDGMTGSIKFLTRFETFTGKFVIHCHILFHEDFGMMQKVEVI